MSDFDIDKKPREFTITDETEVLLIYKLYDIFKTNPGFVSRYNLWNAIVRIIDVNIFSLNTKWKIDVSNPLTVVIREDGGVLHE